MQFIILILLLILVLRQSHGHDSASISLHDPTWLSLRAQLEGRLDTVNSFGLSFLYSKGRAGSGGGAGDIHDPATGKLIPRKCGVHTSPSAKSSVYLHITEYVYGNSGNQYIEFIHGLWLADRFNATLVVPTYMTPMLKVFDLTGIRSQFCFILEHEYLDLSSMKEKAGVSGSITNLELESEESFFFTKIFQGSNYKNRFPKYEKLPVLSNALVQEMSLHFLRVTSLLWGKLHRHIVMEALHLLHKRIKSSTLQYVAVHKRSMEGGCTKLLNGIIGKSDLDAKEFPLNSPEWEEAGVRHPICEYSANFVWNIINLHLKRINDDTRKIEDIPIFLAWDGRGSLDDYHEKHIHVVLASDYNTTYASKNLRQKSSLETSNLSMTLKMLDMLMAVNSELFILNPRSTLSWQIYMVRSILGLPSVPSMPNKDMYCFASDTYISNANVQKEAMKKEQAKDIAAYDGLWVSWESVKIAAANHHKEMHKAN